MNKKILASFVIMSSLMSTQVLAEESSNSISLETTESVSISSKKEIEEKIKYIESETDVVIKSKDEIKKDKELLELNNYKKENSEKIKKLTYVSDDRKSNVINEFNKTISLKEAKVIFDKIKKEDSDVKLKREEVSKAIDNLSKLTDNHKEQYKEFVNKEFNIENLTIIYNTAKQFNDELQDNYTQTTSSSIITYTTEANTIGEKAAEIAIQQVGKSYVWGAKGSNSFDCSGLMYYAYAQAGNVNIGGWTVPQETSGSRVKFSNLQPGDLLFYGSSGATYHVGMYVGNGMMVHALNPSQGVQLMSFNSWIPNFAVRPSV